MQQEYLPSRWHHFTPMGFALLCAGMALVVVSFNGVHLSLETVINGLPRFGSFFSRMFPPDLTRLSTLTEALWVTFLMAVCGTFLGLIFSVPLAFLSARNLTPHPVVGYLSKGLISFFRTVPDLIWALVFVIVIGLGPVAGAFAIMVDTIGFLGKFFAESAEEQEEGPQQAIRFVGGNSLDVAFTVILPSAMPAFVSHILFALEKAVRSSVVLGLVGAGGIGIELKAAIDFLAYDAALTAILMIFILVLCVEQVNNRIRHVFLRA